MNPVTTSPNRDRIGQQIYNFAEELYPICRSITGNGLRATLHRIAEHIPLEIHEVPSGTAVFDWTVPNEWNIRDAYVKNSRGEKVIDFKNCNLHVVNYSVPIHARMSLAELRPHLHSLPDRPDWIPYRTSYYRETWGFCLAHRQLERLEEDEYEVVIDATLEPGYLSYGEYFLAGESQEEILISSHACHPSLCNDNLSGIGVATFLANHLATQPSRRYSYRFLFIPGTIGSITWLSRNETSTPRIRHGLVLAGVGDPGAFDYKKSRRGDADIDRAASYVLRHAGYPYAIEEFSPYGYDERQYCSPGFDLPVGRLSRTPHGTYPQYHTSADDLSFITADALEESYHLCLAILEVLEQNQRYINLNPKCEPQLGKRGLYRALGGEDAETLQLALLWVLNLADGNHTLLDIAERSGLPFETIRQAKDALIQHHLLGQ